MVKAAKISSWPVSKKKIHKPKLDWLSLQTPSYFVNTVILLRIKQTVSFALHRNLFYFRKEAIPLFLKIKLAPGIPGLLSIPRLFTIRWIWTRSLFVITTTVTTSKRYIYKYIYMHDLGARTLQRYTLFVIFLRSPQKYDGLTLSYGIRGFSSYTVCLTNFFFYWAFPKIFDQFTLT